MCLYTIDNHSYMKKVVFWNMISVLIFRLQELSLLNSDILMFFKPWEVPNKNPIQLF